VLLVLSLGDIRLDGDSSEDTGRRECKERVVCSGHDKALTAQKKFIMHSTHEPIRSLMREENGEEKEVLT